MERERMEVFLELFREEPPLYIQELERRAKEDGVPIIRRGTRDVLRYLLRTKQPERVLEVGTATGYSALFMKNYIPKSGTIVTVENFKARLIEAGKNLDRYDENHQIELLDGDAADVLANFSGRGELFDFIFMDAAKGQYVNYLPYLTKILVKGGILVTDNIFHDGDVLESHYAVARRDRTIHGRLRDYLFALTKSREWETICLDVGDGMTISTRK